MSFEKDVFGRVMRANGMEKEMMMEGKKEEGSSKEEMDEGTHTMSGMDLAELRASAGRIEAYGEE